MAVHFILRACADVIFAPDPARGRLSLIKYPNKKNKPEYM